MADKRITDVDFIESLNSDESFFVNHNNTIKQINKGNIVFDIVNGGTGASDADTARENIGAASSIHSHKASDITDGTINSDRLPTIPLSKGGTGNSNYLGTAPKFSVIHKAEDGNYLNYTETDNGAMYASSKNGSLKFGTLPIAQGGTGATDGATAMKNMFAAGNTILSSYQYGDELPETGVEGMLFFKKIVIE